MCPRKGGKQSLEEFVTISDKQVSAMVQEKICQGLPAWLNHAEEHFLDNLDFLKPIRVNTALLIHWYDSCFAHLKQVFHPETFRNFFSQCETTSCSVSAYPVWTHFKSWLVFFSVKYFLRYNDPYRCQTLELAHWALFSLEFCLQVCLSGCL